MNQRTKQQAEANEIDMELFNILRRAELQFDDVVTIKDKEVWVDLQEKLCAARTIVRSLMHQDDVIATSDS